MHTEQPPNKTRPKTPPESFILDKAREAMQEINGSKGWLRAEERDTIVKHLKEVQAAEDLSNAVLARILRVSTSVVSQVLSGKYTGDTMSVLGRARRWLLHRAEVSNAPDVGYVATSVGKAVLSVCRRAMAKGRIGRVVAPAGAGKTLALREYERQMQGEAVYLQAGEAHATKGSFLRLLCRKLGVKLPRTRGTLDRLYEDVRELLSAVYAGGKGRRYCLLVDEATTLKPDCLNMLRNLCDDPDVSLAIVLADTDRLDAELSGHSHRKMLGGYEQLRRRLTADYHMESGQAIAAADVRAVAESVLAALGEDDPAKKIDRDALAYLTRIAQRPGRLGNVAARLEAVWDLADSCNTAPDWSVSQCDFAATLVGHTCEIQHAAPPFGPPAARAARAG